MRQHQRSRATTSTARSSCYTRACFEAIGGVQERLGWDTIDETYARMRGFKTRSFTDLVAVHHRPLGERRRHAARSRPPRRVRLHRALQPPLGRAALAQGRAQPPVRALRRSPSCTATCAPRSAASSACPTATSAGSRAASCAGAWSTRSCRASDDRRRHRLLQQPAKHPARRLSRCSSCRGETSPWSTMCRRTTRSSRSPTCPCARSSLGRNGGFAFGCNTARRQARRPYVLFL